MPMAEDGFRGANIIEEGARPKIERVSSHINIIVLTMQLIF